MQETTAFIHYMVVHYMQRPLITSPPLPTMPFKKDTADGSPRSPPQRQSTATATNHVCRLPQASSKHSCASIPPAIEDRQVLLHHTTSTPLARLLGSSHRFLIYFVRSLNLMDLHQSLPSSFLSQTGVLWFIVVSIHLPIKSKYVKLKSMCMPNVLMAFIKFQVSSWISTCP